MSVSLYGVNKLWTALFLCILGTTLSRLCSPKFNKRQQQTKNNGDHIVHWSCTQLQGVDSAPLCCKAIKKNLCLCSWFWSQSVSKPDRKTLALKSTFFVFTIVLLFQKIGFVFFWLRSGFQSLRLFNPGLSVNQETVWGKFGIGLSRLQC